MNCYRCQGESETRICANCLSEVRYFEVTVLVPIGEGEGDPGGWDWQSLIDTPEPVFVDDIQPLT